jgi:glycosyltransferase involved in cell wall biosynthesis
MPKPRLLYLSRAYPPGISVQLPQSNPAGHGFETALAAELAQHFDFRSIGLVSRAARGLRNDPKARDGVPHQLVLFNGNPVLWYQLKALASLKRCYKDWERGGWKPDLVLTYNLSPVYNAFIRWLAQRSKRPELVVLLADSSRLGQRMPLIKSLRYRCKPLVMQDSEAIEMFDACIGLSQSTERHFSQRGAPFLWMPGACRSPGAMGEPKGSAKQEGTPQIRFGYFGALADYAGIGSLIQVFRSTDISASLHISGYGKLAAQLAGEAAQDSRITFHGFLDTTEACLEFGRSCDVLVNPRPASHGNENNFPSKIFDYALCGRAILTSRMGGVDAVLGEEAIYFDASDYDQSLAQSLIDLSKQSPDALRRRGAALKSRVLSNYTWNAQGDRIAGFLHQLCENRRSDSLRR